MKRFLLLCVVMLVCTASISAVADDEMQTAQDNNAFAVDLYAKLRTQKGNLFFSPESISMALAMTYAGARDSTATQMANVLHFTLPAERLHPAMAGLLRHLNTEGEAHGFQLKVANALWAEKDYHFLDSFLKLTKDNYGAGLNKVDFKTAAEQVRATINDWVAKQTEDKIKDLIPPDAVDGSTRLVLTNAVYFKGSWAEAFDKQATAEDAFRITSSKSVQTFLMGKLAHFDYMDGGSFQAIALPYKGDDLSMVLFLPKAIDGLSAFEQSMTTANLQQWMGSLKHKIKVQVVLPKFKAASEFALEDMLSAMGIKQAFDKSTADFSGMADLDPVARLYISKVIHKAYVDVTEEGTEAAAATAVLMPIGAAMISATPPPPVFRADHPFVFLIRDNHSGSILFMGRMNDPTQ